MSEPNNTESTSDVQRPACVLFSVREANEMDVAVMKKLVAAGCEIVVVQEEHFDTALKAIESLRRRSTKRRITSDGLPARVKH